MKTYTFYYYGGNGKPGNIIPGCKNLLEAITFLTPSKLEYLTKIEVRTSTKGELKAINR